MKLHTVTYGTGPNTLVILHGLLGSERNWHTVARRLADQFYLVIPDQRNHGVSPHDPDHSIRAMTEDLEELVHDRNLSAFFLLGHSMGGHVAMHFAVHHPDKVRALIVEDIAPRSYDTNLAGILDAMMAIDLNKYHAKKDVETALEAGITNAEVRNFVITNLVRHHDHLEWRINLAALREFASNEIRKFKPQASWRYNGPSLFIGGSKSLYKLSDDKDVIQRHFPKAQIAMVKHAGHWVHHEAVDAFCGLVSGFLLPFS